MPFVPIVLLVWFGATAGLAVAAEKPKPVQPDPEYCARRDADPEKCVIQDGPPPKPIVRKKPPPPPQNPPSPEPPPGKPQAK